jgi:natural product biosynthesis luciferase-like monooxygenase protein
MSADNNSYPLSPMQQGMMFHSLYAPQSGVNIQQVIGTLHHNLDAEKFKWAWNQVMLRHDELRTRFQWEGLKEPLQEVVSSVELPVDQQDWSQMSPAECAEKLEQYLKSDRQRGFVMSRAPLMRVALFKEGEQRHQFVWTFHHAMVDGRSFATVLNEVFAYYEAGLKGEEPKLEELRPFREFTQWLSQQDFSRSEQFWREQLKGFTTPTPLVVAKQISANGSVDVEYGEELTLVSADRSDTMRSVAEKHGVGLSTLLQAAWALTLNRYSGEEEVVFGVTRSGRRTSVEGAESMLGIFINTLPVRAHIKPDAKVSDWLKELRVQQNAIREHEHTPLLEIQKWSEMPPGTQLFDTIIVFDRATLNATLQAQGGAWKDRHFRVIDQTNFPLTLFGFAEKEIILKFEFDKRHFEAATVRRMLGHVKNILEALATQTEKKLADLPMLTCGEEHQLLVEWNQTQTEHDRSKCIHELFETQVARTPEAVAVVFQDTELTYRQLDMRANKLANHLQHLGVGPEVLIGICVERSIEMLIGLLGILKAGGAYVPVDPTYPRDRIAHVISDSKMPVLITQKPLVASLPEHGAQVICLDTMDWERDEKVPTERAKATPDNLAYVIYTSGSTGKPKGVMLMHRNVVNFFAGMDKVLGTRPGTWIAVTSISFDISVLELFWTLTRGFKVVIQGSEDKSAPIEVVADEVASRKIDLSLFYFSGDESQTPGDKYRLVLEGAKFADQNGLAAVWTPERHFHQFGGLFPNPSVTSAAIAAITKRVQIRAGSVVLPLHDPVRVAEEWAMVDNISNGRVGLSFASGWHSNDFVFFPENYPDRKNLMFQQIETVKKLWRGEKITRRGGDGKDVTLQILPKPVRQNVPLWVTASASPETFRLAGEIGANILTNLLGQTVEELSEKIAIYRKAWHNSGHGSGEGHVSLMLHTFVERDMQTVREKVRGPFTEYLKTSVDLVKKASSAWSFAAFQKPGAKADSSKDIDFNKLSAEDMQALLDHAFERYFATSGLFGTPDSCLKMVNQLKRVGVDEIACLIDFGVDVDSVLTSLKYLSELNRKSNAAVGSERGKYTIPNQIKRHRVTHFQCTPSLARMLVSDKDGVAGLGMLQEFLVGGEALPTALAEQLTEIVGGRIHNMYGPTETAIWSTTQLIQKSNATDVTIGRPIANTDIYILNKYSQPAAVGLPGELLIGGEGVARGYLNRPELTTERFVPNPFVPNANARLYRTGDLARYRADGTIEFMGRIDHQVKLRGHRIELGEIETALAAHPLVKESVVVAAEEKTGDRRLVGYVVPKGGSNGKSTDGQLIDQWQQIWDGTYGENQQSKDFAFNVAGWTSSYTGQPIPEPEMREWVNCSVERILGLTPKKVLEIGCGTGLLLFRVAPHCEQYCGVDFSEKALAYLQQQLSKHELPQVVLKQKRADDLKELPSEAFDTVIINSVIQYFPNVDYLAQVIEGVVDKVSSGGQIFVGDVRNLSLLEAFHASVEMHQSSAPVTRSQFKQKVQNRIANEGELVIAPDFFDALRQRCPRIGRVEILLKPGQHHNEVTRFRYDAILHVGTESSSPKEIRWIDWANHPVTPTEIKQMLSMPDAEAVGIARIPNARLYNEVLLLQWMENYEGPESIGEFRESLPNGMKGAIDPETLVALGREAGFAVDVTWSHAEQPGAYDILFRRRNIAVAPFVSKESRGQLESISNYANRPAQGRGNTKLAIQLKAHLKQRLPEIMVPSALVILEKMPLTPNGKIDRRSLPSPDTVHVESATEFVPPRNAVESALAAIWCEVLGVEKVGAEDNFFEMGGHSLLATQLISRLRESFRMEIPLRCLFDAPTIDKLARSMVAYEKKPGVLEKTAQILNKLAGMSAEELQEELKRKKAALKT